MISLNYKLKDENTTFSDLLNPSIEAKGIAAFHVEDAAHVTIVMIRPKNH